MADKDLPNQPAGGEGELLDPNSNMPPLHPNARDRFNIHNRLAEKNAADRAEELGAPPPDFEEPFDAPQDRQQQPQPQQPPTVVADDDMVVTVTINGQEVQRTVGDMRVLLATEEATRQNYATANNLLAQARALNSGTEQQQTEQTQGEQQIQPEDDDFDYKDLVERIQLGDPEEAAGAMKELMQGKGRSSADADALVERAYQKLRVEQELKDTFSAIEQQYPHVIRDQGLNEMLGKRTNDVWNEGVKRYQTTGQQMPTYREIGLEAARRVDDWYRGVSGAQGSPRAAPALRPNPASRLSVNLNDARGEQKGLINQPLSSYGSPLPSADGTNIHQLASDEVGRAERNVAEALRMREQTREIPINAAR